jgi:hypothetical protein
MIRNFVAESTTLSEFLCFMSISVKGIPVI